MTFYFYDLETSGVNPREQRIMQFAGQRTNDKLEPIGDIDNVLIKLTEDVLPDPWAILTHKIPPQQTLAEGLTERDFLAWFQSDIATPDTVFVGYNNIRFDDEFIRYLHYRNFADAYEWHWKDNRSRWDLLDVGRMVRALRPDGIKWPYNSDGQPAAKLEMITSVNKISHQDAHTADADVKATLGFAQLIFEHQPKMFNYLLEMRDKNKIAKLLSEDLPFVYTSGRYSSDHLKTTVVIPVGNHPAQPGTMIVYDLRFDPTELRHLTTEEMAKRIFPPYGSDVPRLPAKALTLNKCPAVAPLTVLDKQSQERLAIDLDQVNNHLKLLRSHGIIDKILDAFAMQHKEKQTSFLSDSQLADAQLYEGFFNDADKQSMQQVRLADADAICELNPLFHDTRLESLLPLYRARNFPKSMSQSQQAEWHNYCKVKLTSGNPSRLDQWVRLIEQASQANNTKQAQYLLEELQLYVQSILPVD
ncbi:exodeoxyribonuclease I [Candidatus Saccharibacteria bacterium]|nr:exodeoxyribonuclease I [Candidatus Saccharibacteria bacterium]